MEGGAPAVMPRSWHDTGDDTLFDYQNCPLDVAEEEFFNFMVELKLRNVLNATQCCKLAWWAARCGATGPIQKLGLRPDAQSGKFSEKFDHVVGTSPKKGDFYEVDVGRRPRCEATRVWGPLPLVLPHVCLVEQYDSEPGLADALERALQADELPGFYTSHPSIQAAGAGRIQPISVYMDGVDYSRTDSCLGDLVSLELER